MGCSLGYKGLQAGLVNGHAHIGHGEGGAVVDAVADHADDGVGLEQLDLLELLLRLHAGVALRDAHAGAHGARRDGVVAGEHHRRDPQLLERAHRLGAVRTHAVGEAARGGHLAVEQHPEHGRAITLPLGGQGRVETQRAALQAAAAAARASRAAVAAAARLLVDGDC